MILSVRAAAAAFTCLTVGALLGACGSSTAPSLQIAAGGGGGIAARCGKPLESDNPPLPSPSSNGQVGPGTGLTHDGRRLDPQGRATGVGNFPSGGALTPDGCYYWAVDAGFGDNDAQIVEVATGKRIQVLPLPGTYGQMAFSADGLRAYVSGEPLGINSKGDGEQGTAGDVIHVFAVDRSAGTAHELAPLALPATYGGSGQVNGVTTSPQSSEPVKGLPAGLAVTPDGAKLVVALNNADKAVIVDTGSGATTALSTGKYPFAVAVERHGQYAYVTSELDGTLTKIDIAAAKVVSTVNLGSPAAKGGDNESHPQAIVADPQRDRLYVALANRDLVAIFDTAQDKSIAFIDVGRKDGIGTQPVALALAPDGATLYAAMSGENAITAIAIGSGRAGVAEGTVLGKTPTPSYPTGVAVTPGNDALVWLSAAGFGSGPNTTPPIPAGFPGSDAPPGYAPKTVIGQVGVTPVPADVDYPALSARVDAAIVPTDRTPAPASTPLQAADGGPSDRIKYVFYVIKENRTYDQIYGCDTRGDGDCSLELFGDNNKSGTTAAATGGATPNAHALSRQFSLLDHVYTNSEVSVDGHIVDNSAYATNYVKKAMHNNYSNRGKLLDMGAYPITFAPNYFLYDQLAQQGTSFRLYGELFAGNLPTANDGRSTFSQVAANTDPAFPNTLTVASCVAEGTAACIYDSGLNQQPAGHLGRIDVFNTEFQAQLKAGTVPHFNVFSLPNDHTGGAASTSILSPNAMVADNDLALGQLVQIISNSSIWPQSAIFVIEDDAQAGSDHVDAHRMPAQVISPWVKHGGGVVSTRYDTYSVIRTMELILGLKPLSLNDALAAPMYDVFTTVPDNSPYTAILPQQSLTETVGQRGTMSVASLKLAARLPKELDAVPEPIMTRMIWEAVFGNKIKVPAPGPNASPAELQRAEVVLRLLAKGASRAQIIRHLGDKD